MTFIIGFRINYNRNMVGLSDSRRTIAKPGRRNQVIAVINVSLLLLLLLYYYQVVTATSVLGATCRQNTSFSKKRKQKLIKKNNNTTPSWHIGMEFHDWENMQVRTQLQWKKKLKSHLNRIWLGLVSSKRSGSARSSTRFGYTTYFCTPCTMVYLSMYNVLLNSEVLTNAYCMSIS